MWPLNFCKDKGETSLAYGATSQRESQKVGRGDLGGEQEVKDLRRQTLHGRLGEHSVLEERSNTVGKPDIADY